MISHSCFLLTLYETIESRARSQSADSYTSRLISSGRDAILAKVLEEADEVVRASQTEGEQRVIAEIADLTYHLLVLLAHHKLHPSLVEEELTRRSGVSGLAEKKGRRR